MRISFSKNRALAGGPGRHLALEERERYLFHLMRTVSFFLLRIIEFLQLTALRMVEPEEIERAALAWAAYRGPDRRGLKVTANTTVRFPRVVKNWLRFHGWLAIARAPVRKGAYRLQ